ncbi:hypothetical protein WR25_02915 [Diploscapter pachys]|uniref:Serpin domain-containing protein n=1 Tax=Diploscapter pachys TaxID=2018661 RepID=A0A2A2JGL0_9BILA|nr:hypothetical protein WR25_02915 [Diploscapter pachys]
MSFLEAETSFGLGVLQQFPLNESFVFSPLSIALALSLVHAGAEGETKKQIADAIFKGANDDQLKQHYSSLSSGLANPQKGVEVNIANKAFVRNNFPIKQTYLDAISKSYNATAQNLDFDKATESAQIMNDFVKEQTRGKISEIVKADSIDSDTAAFLINALYLKADWQNEFSKSSTQDADFFTSENSQKKIPFLNDFNVHRDYAANDEAEVLSLKYKDPAYAFNIFLPKEKFGLAKFVKGMTAEKVQNLLKSVKNTYITVKIPKMKIETSQKLNDMLQKVGITKVFTNSAQLDGISDVPLKVSDAMHKAMIEVDEKGVVAAAATSIRLMKSRRPMKQPELIHFTADHPFLFIVSFNHSPIFAGIKMD